MSLSKLGAMDSAGSKRKAALAVMACISLIIPLTEYLTSHDTGRLFLKLSVVAIGLPVVVALGNAILRCVRGRFPALPLVLLGACASGVLFGLLLSLGGVVGRT